MRETLPIPTAPAVAIMVGSDIDASAAPPTYERNRYVVDLVLHYSCRPFFSASEEMGVVRKEAERQASANGDEEATCNTASHPSPHSSHSEKEKGLSLSPQLLLRGETVTAETAAALVAATEAALTPKARLQRRLSIPLQQPQSEEEAVEGDVAARGASSTRGALEELSLWNRTQPASDVFEWYTAPFPPVGVEELGEFHDRDYVKYLAVRETLSDVDERAASAKHLRAEALQPIFERPRRPSLTAVAVGGAASVSPSPLPPPPPRELPELIPIEQDAAYGMVHDAAPFIGLWRTVQTTASGSLEAVRWLLQERSGDENRPLDTGERSEQATERFAALHWFGGRHHARRDAAAGFCFLNDVVLAAMRLRRGLPLHKSKILIVDLDAHHGDGTQEAFFYDDNYFTLSVHGHGTGFFPGTGAETEIGAGWAKGYCANVPLPEGATDALFVPLARSAIRAAVRRLTGQDAAAPTPTTRAGTTTTTTTATTTSTATATAPSPGEERQPSSCLGGIVLVCGADGVQGDAIGRMNYTIAGLQCVTRLVIETAVRHGAKLLVLGAGGYVNTTAARVAAVVTRDVLSASVARRLRLPETHLFFLSPFLKDALGVPVPDTCAYFVKYGPSFLMHGLPGATVPRVQQLAPGAPCYTAWQAFAQAAERKGKREGENHTEAA